MVHERFEELDTEGDSDGMHGVPLSGYDYDRQFFVGSDSGQDLQRRGAHDIRRSEYYADYAYDDDGLIVLDERSEMAGKAMQLAMREREEVLVQRALERIRRAKMMGKQNIRLPAPEHEALQRKMDSDRKAAEAAEAAEATKKGIKGKKQIKEKKSVESRRGSSGARSRNNSNSNSNSNTSLVPASKRKGSRTSLIQAEDRDRDPMPSNAAYYATRSGSARSTSRPSKTPATLFRRHVSDQPVYAQASPSSRSSSRGIPRSLPDEPDWHPRSRSNSSLQMAYDPSMAYDYDPRDYPPPSNVRDYPPAGSLPSRPYSTRRNVSGPAEPGYASSQGHERLPPQHQHAYPNTRAAAVAQSRAFASSDPSLLRERSSGGIGKVFGRAAGGKPLAQQVPAGRSRYAQSPIDLDEDEDQDLSDEDDDDEDEDEDDGDGSDEGVQVDVRAYGGVAQYEVFTTELSEREGSAGNAAKAGAAVPKGRSRRGTLMSRR